MSTEIVIRAVRREEFPAWQVLWEGYKAFYGYRGIRARCDRFVKDN